MTISARIILDSIADSSPRLITMELRYPRYIHAEVLTHRLFSRNASSSRAIPVRKALAMISRDPVEPIHWGANRPGMSANEELSGHNLNLAKFGWNFGRVTAMLAARIMLGAGLHKQIANRVCEPYSHITVLVTGVAPAWANFLALRYHPAAQPEIQKVAESALIAINSSVPKFLKPGQWHLPFITGSELHDAATVDNTTPNDAMMQQLLRCSVARCARVSYLNHDGTTPSIADDLKLYSRLIESTPMHASPAEHQAQPDRWVADRNNWAAPAKHGNLEGWIQYRKTLAGECTRKFMGV